MFTADSVVCVQLFKEGLKDLILKTLRIDCRGNDAMFAVHESACLAMKGLCIHDDARRDMSCAMDNGKYFLSGGCVPLLMGLASTFTTRPTVASAALSACRQLVLTEEAVLVVAQHVRHYFTSFYILLTSLRSLSMCY